MLGSRSGTQRHFDLSALTASWGEGLLLSDCSDTKKLKQPRNSASPLILNTGFRTFGTPLPPGMPSSIARLANFAQTIGKSAFPRRSATPPEFPGANHPLYGLRGSKSPLACLLPLESRQCEMPCGNMD